MELNINEIASAKIQSMHESGEIRKRIEEGVEKSIYSAIDSACQDYHFRSTIEKNIEEVLGVVAKGVKVDAYKNFLISRLNKAFSSYVKKDIGDKIEADFKRIYLDTPKEIKLSQLIEKYKEWLFTRLDEEERRDWEKFDIYFNTEYKYWFDVELKKPNTHRTSELENFCFTIHYEDGTSNKLGYVSSARIGYKDFGKEICLGQITDFEALIFNLLYTRTRIEIDLEEVGCIDTYLYDDDY